MSLQRTCIFFIFIFDCPALTSFMICCTRKKEKRLDAFKCVTFSFNKLHLKKKKIQSGWNLIES